MAESPPAGSSGSGAEASTSGSSDVRVGEERKDSCVPKFDALWFCYCESSTCQCMCSTGRWLLRAGHPQQHLPPPPPAAADAASPASPPRVPQRRSTRCSNTT